MIGIPEPHPLDFDFRFTGETVEHLCRALREDKKILSVGTPSLARQLEKMGRDVLLVDRQPFHNVSNHSVLDVEVFAPIGGVFESAVVDPPWYPGSFLRWVSWTASVLGVGGRILVSIWPESTRPSARLERQQIFEALSGWSTFELVPSILRYEEPRFEIVSIDSMTTRRSRESPPFGDLLEIRVLRIPPLFSRTTEDLEFWHRFVIDTYQIAVRVRPDDGLPSIDEHPRAHGWIWPSVSRRAQGRDEIGLWSSRNEVAVIEGSESIVRAISGHVAEDQSESFVSLNLRPLLEWAIPNPPFQRVLEWTHRS